jgi:sucrose-6-phosphate hydrolase SacC (GH32 family)
MRFTFSSENEKLICSSREQALALIRPEHYQNLQSVCKDGALLFDGYSMHFRGEGLTALSEEAFSVTLRILPLTFSAHGDGLFSFYEETTQEGIEIILQKGGVLNVRLGTGRESIEFPSCNAHVRPGIWNVITLVYRGYAGWCDLYVNGEFSSRKQFRRHTQLSLPDRPWYLGKRVDGNRFREDTPFGHYYGFMHWLEIDDRAPAQAEIQDLHSRWFTGRQEPDWVALGMPDRRYYANDLHRPKYHLCPPGKWMNEPHAPLFYKDYYHIFYQGNPHAPIWDHIAWGHLISRDMIHWEDAPLALTPEGGTISPDGCWSGSSLIDKEGKPRIYFTAGNDAIFPNQSVALATPADATDEKLHSWYQHPEALQRQNIGWMGEFRDPFVWLEKDTYFMLVGTGDENNGGGNAALYSSLDGISWDCHGMLLDYDFSQNAELGHVWELPVMLPLRDESGSIVCHALLLCACQIEGDIVETYYFLGHWDADTRHFEKMHDKARLVDLGKGVFTGPSGFVTPDGRSVLFTIAQGRCGFRAEQNAGWAHNGGMPVELFWKRDGLGVRPIREVDTLRSSLLMDAQNTSAEAVNPLLGQNPGNLLSMEMTAEGDTASVLLCSGEERLEVRYDRKANRLIVLDAQGNEIGRYRGRVDDVDVGNEPIRFSCYLDHSLLEVYMNDVKSVSLRNYFTEPRHFQISGNIQQLKLWEMSPAYPEI